MQHGSPVETSNVHRASQPCCRNSSGILCNNATYEAETKYYIAYGMAWLPFPPQLTFNQLLFSPEDPKPDVGISSAQPKHSVIPSFQVQSACGMDFLLMSVSCHLTASRLNCTPSHWCRHLPALLLSTAPHCSLFLYALFVLLFGITASTSPWCDIARPPSWHLLGRRRYLLHYVMLPLHFIFQMSVWFAEHILIFILHGFMTLYPFGFGEVNVCNITWYVVMYIL